MIHGSPRPQAIHKGKALPSRFTPKGWFIPLSCGYTLFGGEREQQFLWSEDWSEVTCKMCLHGKPKGGVVGEA